jgi:hypothetical protein
VARLTTRDRNELPDSDFAMPETRDYPIEDHGHAVAALSRVEANGTQEEKAQVRSAVRRKFKSMTLQKKGGR